MTDEATPLSKISPATSEGRENRSDDHGPTADTLSKRLAILSMQRLIQRDNLARGRNLRAMARDDLKEWRKRFGRIRLLNEEEQARLAPILTRHVFWVAWIRYWLLNITKRLVNGCCIALLPLSGVGDLFFSHTNSSLMVVGPWGLLFGVAFGTVPAITILDSLSLRNLADYLERMDSRRRYWWVGLFFYFAAVFTDPGNPSHPDPKTLFGEASGIVTCLLLLVAGTWLVVHAHIWGNLFLQRRREALRPQSFIAEGYMRLLFFLNDHPYFLRRPRSAHKREFMAVLEEVAVVLQRDLWQPLSSGDRDTDAWTKKRCAGMGNSLRGLKKWVITPKADTFDQLRDRVVADMIHAAQGEWDAIPTDDTSRTALSRLSAGLVVILRIAVAATIFFLTLNSLGHAPRWVENNSGLILAVFAAIMVLLNRIDPTTSPAITSYNDILKSLEEIGKKP